MTMDPLEFFGAQSGGRSAEDRQSRLARAKGHSPFTDDFLAFGYDFFDNPSLELGYGGYRYDGRYASAAAKMCSHYGLRPGDCVLDVGCAKGFLLREFQRLGLQVLGVDVSEYAVRSAHPDVADQICIGDICRLPLPGDWADLVVAKAVLPYVSPDSVDQALAECARVCRGNAFFLVHSGQNADELESLGEWDANHRAMKTPEWWRKKIRAMGCPSDVEFNFLFRSDVEI